jgi:nucleoside-diphosphate-sugar epimerase
MDVLVTGGAGFIGSHLVSLLVKRGAAVRVMERPGARVDHLPLDRIDLVYHLAANPNLWNHRRGHFTQVNYRGAVHVLDSALEAGARRVLHTSTESILTRARQSGAIRED